MSLARARRGRSRLPIIAGAWPGPARRLFAARFLRSLAQGSLVVDFTLYLRLLHWSATAIGALLAGSFVLGAVLSLLVGPASDRCGCKPLLVGYELAIALAFFATAWTTNPWVIGCAAVFAGFGRGANGAPGCFVPAELSWLARVVPAARRGAAYSINTAMGFIGMGLGALLAITPAFWTRLLPGAAGYRPLFLLGGGIAVAIASLLAATPEQLPCAPAEREARAPPPRSAPLRRGERRRLWQIAIISLFSGVSLGLSGPLIAYWLAVKFRVDPMHIAPVLAVAFVAAALSAFATAWLAERFGAARSFVFLQGFGILLLFSFPFIPSFTLAAAVWILRFAIERGATGAMEAVIMGLVRAHKRGLAGGLGTASLALPRALGPLAAGYWIAAGDLATPFVIAAALQSIYAALFGIAFFSRDRAITDS